MTDIPKWQLAITERQHQVNEEAAALSLMLEHTDRDGTVHNFKVGRKSDGEWVGDKAFIDLYEFEQEGNKPTFKLRLKRQGEEKGAWWAAGWPPKEERSTPSHHEAPMPTDDDFPGGW